MRSMEELRATATPPSVIGYRVVLVGALGFVVGCFLPYAEASTPHSWSLYRLITTGEAPVAVAGGHLYLFAGAAAIALISLAALKEPRAWAFPALSAASIVWSLTWIGILLGGYGFYTSLNVGYWLMLACVCAVIVGTALVWTSSRRAEVVEPEE